MANEIEDAISAEIIKTKGWHLVPVKKQPFLEERLMAGFVWQRVRDLLASVGQANIRKRIDDELNEVRTFLNIRIGADRKSGTYFTRPPGSSDTNNHLDLADLALQRVSGNDPGKVRRRIAAAIDTRSRAVLMIVWRAAVFEAQVLWRNSPTLDKDALDEVLDRRLRAVERMRYQVGDRSTMMRENNAKFNFVVDPTGTSPTAGWFDELRVRLFEYMSFLPDIFLIPGISTDVWEGVVSGNVPIAANYNVFPVSNRTIGGAPFHASPANAWRFPADVADKWQVSLASDGFGEIDFTATTPFNPAPILDSLFDYRGVTTGGDPRKRDIWNRAWLLCDHVLAVIQLEALLFALRRRPGVTNPENVLQTLVQKRPTVTVTFDEEGPQTFDTAFVALGGRVRNENESPGTGGTVLMMSDKPLTDQFGDPYFRNELTSVDGLQVGDQVKFLNATVYSAITRNQGIWKLENAFVLEVEPTANSPVNRTGVEIGSLRVQGHGTVVETYDSMRETLGRELDGLFEDVYRKVKKRGVLPRTEGDDPALRAELQHAAGVSLGAVPREHVPAVGGGGRLQWQAGAAVRRSDVRAVVDRSPARPGQHLRRSRDLTACHRRAERGGGGRVPRAAPAGVQAEADRGVLREVHRVPAVRARAGARRGDPRAAAVGLLLHQAATDRSAPAGAPIAQGRRRRFVDPGPLLSTDRRGLEAPVRHGEAARAGGALSHG
jgi:hypothetical protein